MIDLDPYLDSHRAFLLLQIHDELLYEAPDSTVKELSQKVRKEMEGVMKLKVPLKVEVSIGKNWGEC